MIIISGCNSSFYLCIRQFLNNIKHYIRPCDKLYVVDLGLTNKQYNFLKSRNYQDKFNFELVQIPHEVIEKYPPHVKDLQTYAFKALIFDYLILKKYTKQKYIVLTVQKQLKDIVIH